MATVHATVPLPPTLLPTEWTMADLQAHLGSIPPERIRLYPPPGMATEQDVLNIDDHEDRLCELVDGILVEKVTASFESLLASILIQWGSFSQPCGAPRRYLCDSTRFSSRDSVGR